MYASEDSMKLTYEPIDIQHAPHRPDLATSKRCECTQCGKTFVASAAVCVCLLPFTENRMNEWQGHFYLYCDHCQIIHRWFALTDESGSLPGRQISRPTIIVGKQLIADFLTKYPHATGMEQV